jgi:hypothetical protein
MRLQQSVKSLGLAVFERLQLSDAVLTGIATDLKGGPFVPTKNLVHELGDPTPRSRFLSLTLLLDDGRATALHGPLIPRLVFTAEERQHLASGRTVLKVLEEPGRPAGLVMFRFLDPVQPDRGLLAGEVNGDYLWCIIEEEFLPAGWEVCIFDHVVKAIPDGRRLARRRRRSSRLSGGPRRPSAR